MSVNYRSAPLPFRGQKRYFIRDILAQVTQWQQQGIITPDTLILDVFGGSGLIAHNIKQVLPDNTVVWNDFDNYAARLDNIPVTRLLRDKIAAVITPFTLDNKISVSAKNRIIRIIEQHAQQGLFTDYLTLSSWLLFSGRYAQTMQQLKKHAFYPGIVRTEISATGYLAGVDRESGCFTELLDKYRDNKNKLLILDPPYMQTCADNAYSVRWSISAFLKLMQRLQPPYILFGSGRSDILDYFQYMQQQNPVFADVQIKQRTLGLNTLTDKSDYMLSKAAL